jgi:hypothetical protein
MPTTLGFLESINVMDEGKGHGIHQKEVFEVTDKSS